MFLNELQSIGQKTWTQVAEEGITEVDSGDGAIPWKERLLAKYSKNGVAERDRGILAERFSKGLQLGLQPRDQKQQKDEAEKMESGVFSHDKRQNEKKDRPTCHTAKETEQEEHREPGVDRLEVRESDGGLNGAVEGVEEGQATGEPTPPVDGLHGKITGSGDERKDQSLSEGSRSPGSSPHQ